MEKIYNIKNVKKSGVSQKAYSKKVDTIASMIFESANVFVTTCVSAGSKFFAGRTFDTILIDESTQSLEAETLIPLQFKCKRVVLVGDHRQLGPIAVPELEKLGWGCTFFERTMYNGIEPVQLNIQYRMHPSLAEFPSNYFYEGRLRSGVTEYQRRSMICSSFLAFSFR